MNLTEIILILLVHYLADFILQTNNQATKKSENIYWLLSHTLTYSFIWVIVGFIFLFPLEKIFLFFIITLFFHTLTDFLTSRVTKYFWVKGNKHLFFSTIGFDQFLHYIQLFIAYKFL